MGLVVASTVAVMDTGPMCIAVPAHFAHFEGSSLKQACSSSKLVVDQRMMVAGPLAEMAVVAHPAN